jgi:hypothetical protein
MNKKDKKIFNLDYLMNVGFIVNISCFEHLPMAICHLGSAIIGKDALESNKLAKSLMGFNYLLADSIGAMIKADNDRNRKNDLEEKINKLENLIRNMERNKGDDDKIKTIERLIKELNK